MFHFCPFVTFYFIHGGKAVAAAVKCKCQWTVPISCWQSWGCGAREQRSTLFPQLLLVVGGQKWPPAVLTLLNIFLQQMECGERLWAKSKLLHMSKMFMNQKFQVFGGLVRPLCTCSHMCKAHAILGKRAPHHPPYTTHLLISDFHLKVAADVTHQFWCIPTLFPQRYSSDILPQGPSVPTETIAFGASNLWLAWGGPHPAAFKSKGCNLCVSWAQTQK